MTDGMDDGIERISGMTELWVFYNNNYVQISNLQDDGNGVANIMK